jgi:signal peptidase I
MSVVIEETLSDTAMADDQEPIDTTANRRVRRRMVQRVVSVIGLAVFLVAAWFLWPVRWGGTFAEVVVTGHSMEPTFHTGDLVVTKKDDHYRIGEKVVYQIPKGEPGAGIHVVHRIIGTRSDGTLVLQGDNRLTPDTWRPRPRDVVGRVVTVVPQAGRVLVGLSNPWVLAALIGLILTVWLWPEPERPARPEAEAEAEAGAIPEIRIEPIPMGEPRADPWWADEAHDADTIDERRSDHVMPSAPDSSEWDEITMSASSNSDVSS